MKGESFSESQTHREVLESTKADTEPPERNSNFLHPEFKDLFTEIPHLPV